MDYKRIAEAIEEKLAWQETQIILLKSENEQLKKQLEEKMKEGTKNETL